MMSDGGKGSRPRPYSVSQQEYDTRWDAIFCRDLQDEKKEEYRVNKLGQTERFHEGQWEIYGGE
jgi:hypothetical protein